MNTEILKGLSIEELEERAEFTAVTDELPTGYEGMDDAAKQRL